MSVATRVSRGVAALAILALVALCVRLLIPSSDETPSTPVSSGRETAEEYWTDERMRDAVSAMPTWNPLPALVTFVVIAALVFLAIRLVTPAPSGRFERIVRPVFALSTGFAVATLVPLYYAGGGPRMDCVDSGGTAVLILLAFAVFGGSGGLWLDRRWWLLLVAVPAALGVVRFGVDCGTGIALMVGGAILGLATAGLRPQRSPVDSG